MKRHRLDPRPSGRGACQIFTQQTSLLLRVTFITIGIGLIYWAAVILPQRGKAWNLLHAVVDEEES
jgi:hypothetical protein